MSKSYFRLFDHTKIVKLGSQLYECTRDFFSW